MLKKCFMVLLISLCTFLIPTAGTPAADSDVIENNEEGIPNEDLYLAVLKALGKKIGDNFTEGEAKRIDKLCLDISNGDSLKGIGCLSGLKGLELSYHEYAKGSLRGIEELTSLKRLKIEGGYRLKMQNLTCLKGLTGLESLSIIQGNITALRGIEAMVNLKTLTIEGDQLTSLNGIQHLQQLESLCVPGNCLTSLKGIEGLKNLKLLDARHNSLVDIKEVRSLKKLRRIYMTGNNLENVDALKSLKKLERLQLDENRIAKLPNMKKLTKLNYFYTYLGNNFLCEKELTKKLPAQLLKRKGWMKKQKKSQNQEYAIRITTPGNGNLTEDTKRIVGQVSQKGAIVQLLHTAWNPSENDIEYNWIKTVKSDENGRFVIKNLKLFRYWKGKFILRMVDLSK